MLLQFVSALARYCCVGLPCDDGGGGGDDGGGDESGGDDSGSGGCCCTCLCLPLSSTAV